MAKNQKMEIIGSDVTFFIEFMGIWERVNNPDVNLTEFSYIRNESGGNGYVLSAKQ